MAYLGAASQAPVTRAALSGITAAFGRALYHIDRTMQAASNNSVRVLAYYLPQFHAIPENDRWWGHGFTEWTTVRAARPLFAGHRQPRVPAELGFYDLRDDQVRDRQALLAREAGVEAFIYWHYWFAGRRLLEMPSERLMARKVPTLGFCFAWANAPWSRAWTGNHDDILVPQDYPGVEDYRSHYEYLRRAFDDDRYVRVRGRPLFLIFRPDDIPDLPVLVTTWGEAADRHGEARPYIVGEVDFTRGEPAWLAERDPPVDGVVEFSWIRAIGEMRRLRLRLPGRRRPVRVSYERVVSRLSVRRLDLVVPQYPLVLAGWDNTPRYGPSGIVVDGYTPAALENALNGAHSWAASLKEEDRLLIVKSWNEWSEGNYLEPDEFYGRAWIDACRRGIAGS